MVNAKVIAKTILMCICILLSDKHGHWWKAFAAFVATMYSGGDNSHSANLLTGGLDIHTCRTFVGLIFSVSFQMQK